MVSLRAAPILALAGELDAAGVEVGDVGRELVDLRGARRVRLGLLADDALGLRGAQVRAYDDRA